MHHFEAREMFFILDMSVTALLGRGGKSCRKGMKVMDTAFEKAGSRRATVPLSNNTDEARVMLRARCGLCQNRCKQPLA